MRIIKPLTTILALFLTLFACSLHASDLEKEKRWANQIVDSIMTGDAQWLKADGQAFLSIYTENEADKALGGAIILHGVGVHPNWVDIVQPLRTRLPEYGWHTLSLQMPILANDAEHSEYPPLFSEVAPRINAGIDYLKDKGINNIVLIGHSMGSGMAAYYIANYDRPEVQSLVAIGAAGLLFKDPERDFIVSMKKIKKPIMDLSGSEDLPDVLETKLLKARTAKEAGLNNYHQVEIEGANHFLVGKEDEMLKEISQWIEKFGVK